MRERVRSRGREMKEEGERWNKGERSRGRGAEKMELKAALGHASEEQEKSMSSGGFAKIWLKTQNTF